MSSALQWICATTTVAVFDVSRQAGGEQLVCDLLWVSMVMGAADVLWVLWGWMAGTGVGIGVRSGGETGMEGHRK